MAACGSGADSSGSGKDSGSSSDSASDGDAGDAGSDSGEAKRVCFVARASADTFAAWLTSELKKNSRYI